MYGYMLLSGKFYELGEIELGTYHYRDGSMMAFPVIRNPNDSHVASRVHKVWMVSDKEGEVYKHRTVWLNNNNPELAKRLIAKVIKDRRDIEIEKVNTKYQKAIEALNISDDIYF